MKSSHLRCTDKNALVTGAGSGIGRTTAILMAREGASVVCTDIDPPAAARATQEKIVAIGGMATSSKLDVADEIAWKTSIESFLTQHGRLDVLVNNARVSLSKPITEFAKRSMSSERITSRPTLALLEREFTDIVGIRQSNFNSHHTAHRLKCFPQGGQLHVSATFLLGIGRLGNLHCRRQLLLGPSSHKTPEYRWFSSWSKKKAARRRLVR